MSKSFATLPADKVLQACQAYLAGRQAAINARREPLIRREMKRWTPWRALTGRYPTREEAIETLESLERDPFSQYSLIPLTGLLWAGRVEDLSKLCQLALKHGVNEVQVSADLAEHLL